MPSKHVIPVSLLTMLCLLTSTAVAAPRDIAPLGIGSGDMFVGTPAELVAAAMPEMLARTGVQVEPAAAPLIEDLETAFQGSPDFAWAYTFTQLDEQGNGFSFTLPARVDRIRDGVLVLGVVEGSRLELALLLKAMEDGGVVTMSFMLPDGTKVTTDAPSPPSKGKGDAKNKDRVVLMRGPDGQLLASPADLLLLSRIFYPDAAKGTFDGIIDALQGVLNALYQALNIINMAICAVNEAIEAMYEMNACPLYDIDLGTGDLAYALVCLVQGVMGFVNEVQGCF